jgi:hypothetical protein
MKEIPFPFQLGISFGRRTGDMEAIFGCFDNYEQARGAVELLLEHRFREETMNVIAADYVIRDRFRGKLNRVNTMGSGLGPGLDRLMAGEQPLNTSDAGSIYAAGDEATTLAKTASLAASRLAGLAAALESFGMPREIAMDCVRIIKGGGVLFWLKADDDRVPDGANILRGHKARHVASYGRERLPGLA